MRRLCCDIILLFPYRSNFLQSPRELRQNHLLQKYGFNCECKACTQNYATKKPKINKETIQLLDRCKVLEDVEEGWKKIEENYQRQSPYEIAELIATNKNLLEHFVFRFIH